MEGCDRTEKIKQKGRTLSDPALLLKHVASHRKHATDKALRNLTRAAGQKNQPVGSQKRTSNDRCYSPLWLTQWWPPHESIRTRFGSLRLSVGMDSGVNTAKCLIKHVFPVLVTVSRMCDLVCS